MVSLRTYAIGVASLAAGFFALSAPVPLSAQPIVFPAGCTAVNAGLLDLNVTLDRERSFGSSPVGGFDIGDVLEFAVEVTGLTTFRHHIRFDALDPQGPSSVINILSLSKGELGAGVERRRGPVRFVLGKANHYPAFFTSSWGVGSGHFRLTVKCVPHGDDPEGTKSVS